MRELVCSTWNTLTNSVTHLQRQVTTFTRPLVLITGLVAILLSPVLISTGIAHADINNTRADAWGTQELASTDWLNGAGVPIYSNGSTAGGPSPDTYKYINNKNNTSTQTGIEWQCVEMVNRLYISKGWTTSTWSGNGNTLVNNVPSGLTKENDGSISYLNPGDVITLDDGGNGHAGIINSVGSTIQIVNQNTGAVYSSASVASGTSFGAKNADIDMSGWAGYNVQAVIHAPTTSASTIPTHRDLAWYDGTNLYGFQAYGYGTSATQSGYSTPYWAGAGQLHNSTGKEGVFWYLNNGSDGTTGTIYWIPGGNFSSATAIRSGIGLPVWAGVGDFTGDNQRDSIAWYDGTTLYLFTGSSLGTTWSTTGYSTPAWVGVGRPNNGSYDELFWYLSSSTTIYTLTSTGSGFNGASAARGPGIGAPTWAGVGDFHGDGYRDALAWYDGTTLYTFEGSSLSTSGSITGYSTPTWAGVGQWDSSNTKDGLFWYLAGSNTTIYGISSNGTSFNGAATLRGPGIGAPVWADTGNFY